MPLKQYISKSHLQLSKTISPVKLEELEAMTALQKMAMLNNLAGNFPGGGWPAAKAQIKLIVDELRELSEDGVAKRNIHEIRDGIADVLVTVYGLVHRCVGQELDPSYRDLGDVQGRWGWETIQAQLEVLQGYVRELETAIRAEDDGSLGALAFYVLRSTHRLAHIVGVDSDADLHEVVLSNLTKFDPVDSEDVRLTVRKYLNLGVETVQIANDHPLVAGAQLYVSRSAFDQTGTDNKSYFKGKWLKSANFCEPEFAALSVRAQERLGLVKVHRGLGQHAFGIYVEAAVDEQGYYARAVDTFKVGELVVEKGDLVLVSDVNTEDTTPEELQPNWDIPSITDPNYVPEFFPPTDASGLEVEQVSVYGEDDIPGSE